MTFWPCCRTSVTAEPILHSIDTIASREIPGRFFHEQAIPTSVVGLDDKRFIRIASGGTALAAGGDARAKRSVRPSRRRCAPQPQSVSNRLGCTGTGVLATESRLQDRGDSRRGRASRHRIGDDHLLQQQPGHARLSMGPAGPEPFSIRLPRQAVPDGAGSVQGHELRITSVASGQGTFSRGHQHHRHPGFDRLDSRVRDHRHDDEDRSRIAAQAG